jgi:hypothetical protein
MIPFATLDDYILAPLQGRDDAAWSRGPDGRWSPGQIVDHLTNAIELSAQGFGGRIDKPPMARRPPTFKERGAKLLVLGWGVFPGKFQAPKATVPGERPDRATTEARLRAGVAAFLDLERRLLPDRARDLYLKHPRFGDLTLAEFMQFHVRHAVHHRKQIVERLRTEYQSPQSPQSPQ